MDDLISIIIPVYNANSNLKKCLNSIVNQTYKNLEIILVDDGSLDNSFDICNRYAKFDKRIKLYGKENTGVSDTRNFGIDKSTGNYIMFVDSDDWIDEDMCEYLMYLNKKYDAEIATCKYYINDVYLYNKNDEIKVVEGIEIITDYFNKSDIMTCVWNKLYRRELVINNKFISFNNNGEDVIFTCKILSKCKKIVCSNLSKYHYNTNNISITRSDLSINKVKDNIENHEIQLEYIKQNYSDNFQLQHKVAEKLLNTLLELYNQIDKGTEQEIEKMIIDNISKTYNEFKKSNYINKRILNKIYTILRHPYYYRIRYKFLNKIKLLINGQVN